MYIELMKISAARYGFGGYDDAMFGLSLTFSGKASGVSDFHGTWASAPSSSASWTVEDQRKVYADTAVFIRDILKKAGRKYVQDLVGLPCRVSFDSSGRLQSWELIEELL